MAAEKRLAYAAFLPVLLLTLRILPSDSPNGSGGGDGGQTLDPPAARYVVRFVEYRRAEEHRDYLEAGLRGAEAPWRWVERRNPAAAFPTDFAVLEIRDEHRDAVVEAVRALGRVRDVHADATYSRGVLSADLPPRQGKLFTAMSFEGEEEGGGEKDVVCSRKSNSSSATSGRKLLLQRSQVTSLFGAERLWGRGFTGKKVKMAIFDTGIRADHPHFRNIKERTNWTNEDTLNDNLGHGTFVAGVIAGQDAECPGFAPDTEIYAFRVFTDAQISYTSWFLDAFNYAIAIGMDVLNLSIGGPDYLDLPFVEKVWELTANNIIMVSAIGNDGPLYGTLNNPADQSDVIGVGGIDYNNHIASFSSRGMTTWELPHGYGRVKPDVVAYSRDIMGSKISTGCKTLSGTSVASPVVAGVVCLLVSVVPEDKRKSILNPAAMKQALVEGASKLSGPNMYEQGAGRLDLWQSYEILKNYQPRASIFPSMLDFTGCPYFWPFCRQPLYAGAMPVIFNATILNGMGVIGYVKDQPLWQPSEDVGNLLSVHFTYSDVIWPWTGYLALHLQVKDEGSQFSGVISGNVTLTVNSPAAHGESSPRSSTCVLYLKIKVVPTPVRSRRILWDQYHNIKYPSGYVPRDSLNVHNDILDWHGDHLHTNFHILFNMLRDAGYYIETLGSPLTCFDASNYGTLLMVDLEEEYFDEEIQKLTNDVVHKGLGVAVFAEWYHVDTMVKMTFFDENTRSWWTPITGGANIPALNELLAPFGISLGDKILTGDFSINGEQTHYASGTDIVQFPAGGFLHSFELQENSKTAQDHIGTLDTQHTQGKSKLSSILGMIEAGEGRIAVYGDSNCLDSSHMVTNCYWLLKKIVEFTGNRVKDPILFSEAAKLKFPVFESIHQPSRRPDVNFSMYSTVVGKELICHQDSRFEVWGTKGYVIHPTGTTRKLPEYQMDEGSSTSNLTIKAYDNGQDEIGLERNFSTPDAAKFDDKRDYFGFVGHEEVDIGMLTASQWMVPCFVATSCLMLYLSCRVQQKRRRRRKGSVANRLTSMV
ncbi:subtilisin-like protease SBT6.1 [Phragmites australis]|uniref:subtilisin-like protease SBT6.1 n=1 Tax=Phragmites australis TaxID=29695 RepID=UPI002D782C3A|nr:subtilisin-like protease SBT6.1 [Phragmites australis]